MKEPFPLDAGRIVESTQGRDKGHAFLVLETMEDGRVLVADGFHHKLANPKKKKAKHLRAKPIRIDLSRIRPEGGKTQDSDLRRALEENGFAPGHKRDSHFAHERKGG